MKTEKYQVTGMTCAACQANVTRCVSKLEGVDQVEVSLLANQMTVSYDQDKVTPGEIVAAVEKIGYGAASLDSPRREGKPGEGGGFRDQWQSRQDQAQREEGNLRRRLILSLALLIPLMYVSMGPMWSLPLPFFLTGMENVLVNGLTQLLLTLPVLLINRRFYQNGLKALFHRAPNMDSLVAVGSGASLLYGLFALYLMAYGLGHGDHTAVETYGHGLYFESAAMIVTLVTVGKTLEAKSKSKTSDALGKLVDLAPKTAVVLRDGEEHTIPAQDVAAGDIVVIRPGEGIPVDGVVTQGYGYVNQAAITGESIPVEKNPGDRVISATINQNGTFQFRASQVGEDTTLAQIIRLVDEAGNSKAPIARLADRVSGIFVPVVIGIALVTAFVWLALGWEFEFALSNAISVLVISCPCALGLATPVAIMVGTGKAAEMGILVKSAESLENLHNIQTIVLDKTGTITSGHPSVTDVEVWDAGMSREDFLARAAALEAGSEHPLAQAVVEKARQEGLPLLPVRQFSAQAGRGVEGNVDGHAYLAGNLAFLEEKGVIKGEEERLTAAVERFAKQGKTPLLFARDGQVAGLVAVADTVRESSRRAIARLQKMGLRVVMLTGDHPATAEAIRRELGLEQAIAGVLPHQKEAHIRQLQQEGQKVAMVGDGINDAPALVRSDIGIAIGAGTDIAIDSADVVLMRDSLEDVVRAIELSRAVVRNIHMNLFWAFFYNVLGIPVAAGVFFPLWGWRLSPMIASAAMSFSSVCVVTNALRLRFFQRGKTQAAPQDATPENQPVEHLEKGRMEMKKVLTVEGMMCAHCQAHVKQALEAVEGVSQAEVSLEEKKARVTLDKPVEDQVLMDAVSQAGYTPVDCAAL